MYQDENGENKASKRSHARIAADGSPGQPGVNTDGPNWSPRRTPKRKETLDSVLREYVQPETQVII
jgi:hypothetical protein